MYNYNKQLSIFSHLDEDKHFVLLPHIKFHFFTSHVPCGDASIIPKFTDCNSSVGSNKRKDTTPDIQIKTKRKKPNETASNESSELKSNLSMEDRNVEDSENTKDNDNRTFRHEVNSDECILNDCVGEAVLDIHRTGAKCVPSGEQDSKLPGIRYHVLGAVRTKPGRGDPTLSVSCSDKMARWIAVGIQVCNICF